MDADKARQTAEQDTTQLPADSENLGLAQRRPPLRIVLCGTSHPGNIGGAARAMKVMGLTRLILVDPKPGSFPNDEATARAVSAVDILQSAEVVSTLQEAVADCSLVVGTTARERHIGPQVLLPRTFCEQAETLAAGGEVALVFGRERSGLSNEEVDLCQRLVRIPTQVEFASLNLAAAVQILAYEWIQSVASLPPPKPVQYRPATSQEVEGFMQHKLALIDRSGFFAGKNQEAILRRIRRIYARADLDTNEINILRGFLSAMEKTIDAKN
ncbi:MAG: RNA methyltransferase [Oceanococcus sp.]